MMKKVLITGSTGKVGSAVVEELAKGGEAIVAASRRPETLKMREGVEVIRFDYADTATYNDALRGVDRVFLMEPQPPVGPADVTMLPMMSAASERGCKVVLLSSASAAAQEEPLSRVEAAVKDVGRHIILRPNWFMDNFHTWWAESIKYHRLLPLPAGDARSPFIDARDVGAAAAAALRRDDLDGKIFQLTGGESLTYSEAASLLGTAIGDKVRYEPINDIVFSEMLLQAGLQRDHIKYVTSLFRLTRNGVLQEPTDDFEMLVARKARSLKEYASYYCEAWR